MYARGQQRTPNHTHKGKQEDIICRVGTLAIQLFGCDEKGECSKQSPAKLLRMEMKWNIPVERLSISGREKG